MYCSMRGCKLTRQACLKCNINMFLFPSIPKQRQAWITNCEVEGELRKDAFVCALHFGVNDVTRLGVPQPMLKELEYNGTSPSKPDFPSLCTALKRQCRSCLKTDCTKYVDMLTLTTGGINLFDYFNECTRLNASVDDGLPGLLCLPCSRALHTAYNFQEEARRSDTSLRLVLSLKSQMETEPPAEITILEQPAVIGTEFDFTYQPEDKDVDPLGDLESIEEKPNVEELLIEIGGNAEKICKEEQPISMDFEIVKYSDDESLPDEIQHCVMENAKEFQCAELETEVETADETETEAEAETQTETESDAEVEVEDEDMDEDWIVSRKGSKKIKRKCYTCQYCQTIEPTLDELRKHLIQTHKSEMACEKCAKNYNYPHELEQHNKLVHDVDSPVQCTYCPQLSPIPRSELVKHFRLKHCHRYNKYFPNSKHIQTDARFQCAVCMRYYVSAGLLADHVHVHSNDKPYKCKFCPMEFNMKRTFQAHLKRKHDVVGSVSVFQREIEGEDETENALSKSTLRPLRKEIEVPTQYQCEICKRYCASAALLSDHLHCHADDKPYECEHCPKRFNMKRTYQVHLRRKHDFIGRFKTNETDDEKEKSKDRNALIQCTECNKEFAPIAFKRHKARHEEKNKKQKFLCAFCPRLFRNKMVMQAHEKKIHLNERPETKECNICKKKFALNYLTSHITRVHAEVRNFACRICGNAFKSQAQLDLHTKLHGEREFECSVCHKKYIRKCDLNVHMRSHTGEQPYSCHICDKRFSVRVRLTYHLQRHAGYKHRCKECGKEFNQTKMLRQHSYKHTGMPYRCPSCGYGCVLRDVFTRHLQRMHGIVMTDAEMLAMFKQNTGRTPRVPSMEQLKNSAAANILNL